jgi:hypothetical protein
MARLNRFATLALVVFSLFVHLNPAKAQNEVDLALVLAVDISNFMDPEEQELQRQGCVEAVTEVIQPPVRSRSQRLMPCCLRSAP